MKDLYRQVGIDRRSDIETIRNRIRDNPGKSDPVTVKEILLNAPRKRVYDRAHRTAFRIGVLEANLSLPFDEATRDFRAAYPNNTKELALFAQSGAPAKKPPTKIPVLMLLRLVAFGLLLLGLSQNGNTSKTDTSESQNTQSNFPLPRATATWSPAPFTALNIAPTPAPFNQPVVPFPRNGSYTTYTNKALGPRLEITTPPGDTNSYYCKLVNIATGKTEMVMFVEGGQTTEFRVPIGSYRLKYAYGFSWYGPEYLFGPGTVCVEAETIVQFSIQGDQYLGHSIELYKRPNGNFETANIPMSQF